MRKGGLEPPRPHGHTLLRRARLPFRHFRAASAVLDCGTWAILPRMSEPRAGASGDDGRRVVVVGGGPAGLTAAWALMKAGVRAVVLEKDTQFGGHARTV